MDFIEGLHFLHMMAYVEDLEHQRKARTVHRSLRDSSDPFQMPDHKFMKLFHLSKELVHHLIAQLMPELPRGERCTAVPVHIKVLAALQFYVQGSYQATLGQDFNLAVSQPTVSRCIRLVSAAIVKILLPKWVRFPTESHQIVAAKNGFMAKYNFPGVIGAIDGTHIAIIAPPVEDKEFPQFVYNNGRGYYSLNVQIITDTNLVIQAMNAKYPGSVSDSDVWMTSDIRSHLKAAYERGDKETWLLGDTGYNVEPWLMTPINEAKDSSPEAKYNAAHSQARSVTKECIGILRSRFQCLRKRRALRYTVPAAGRIIYACAVLHNMAIKYNVPNPANEKEGLEEESDSEEENKDEEDEWKDDSEMEKGQAVQMKVVKKYFLL